jgi:WD40 repeat protein
MWGSLGAAAVAAAVGFGLWNKDRSESPDELTTRPEPTVPVKQPTEVARKSPVREKANRPLNAQLFDASVAPLSEFRRMSVPGEQINALAVSPDGTRVYAGCTDGIIYVWDTRTGKEVRRYRGHKPSTLSILLSPDGTRMVTFGGDRVMRVHNTATGSQILTVRMGIPFRGAALSPDGTEVAVAFYGGKAGARLAKMSRPRGVAGPPPVHDQVSIFSTVTGERLRLLSTPRSDSFRSVDWSPDGRWIAAGIEEGRVLLLVAKTGAVEKDLKVLADDFPGPAHEVHFSRDGTRLFAAGSGNLVWGWEVPGGRRILRRRFMQGVVRFAASPDNRWLAFGGGLKIRMLSLRDSAGNAVDVNLEGHTSPSVSAAFVPNADVLVSYGWDGTVRLWRLPADTSPVDGSKKPLVRRLLGTDGYAADANFDGVFETVETKRPDLRVTRDDGAGILPREVALLEFDTKPYRGDDLVGAALEVKITLAQSSNVDPVFDLEVHAYPADGKVAVEDATAAGALAAKLTSHNRNSLGKLRIALDTPLIRKLMSQNGRVGLRISNTRGDRMIFAGRRYYVKDSAPVLELHLRPQR